MPKKEKVLKKISIKKISVFKIKNRKGYAALCMNNLTEGATKNMALARMDKALNKGGRLNEL